MCDCAKLDWKEKTLATLGGCTCVWGGFAFLYSALFVFVGLAWTQGDVRIANLTVPFVLSSLCVIGAGVLDVSLGSGLCAKGISLKNRRYSLMAALGARAASIVLILYVVIWISNDMFRNNYPPSPPGPPLPMVIGEAPPSAPPSPYPPSWPPNPPWSPVGSGSEGILGFFNVAAWLTFAVLIVAPVFEVIVLCDLSKQKDTGDVEVTAKA